MNLYPAIDLKDGACVRLVKGNIQAATRFNTDPAAQAKSFAAAGFNRLHIVDLDGAFSGNPVNRSAVEGIITATDVPSQLGGGIRDMATIEGWLEAGVSRVILGTIAVRDPDLVRAACRKFPGQIALGLDARSGRVAVDGWVTEAEITASELALRFEDAGAAAIIFTDIDRDGVLGGVNVKATAALASLIKTPVIASGGVASLDDLAALKDVASSGIEGAIIGRALYDGHIDPAAALALAAA